MSTMTKKKSEKKKKGEAKRKRPSKISSLSVQKMEDDKIYTKAIRDGASPMEAKAMVMEANRAKFFRQTKRDDKAKNKKVREDIEEDLRETRRRDALRLEPALSREGKPRSKSAPPEDDGIRFNWKKGQPEKITVTPIKPKGKRKRPSTKKQK